jgi:acetyl esterase/lipase
MMAMENAQLLRGVAYARVGGKVLLLDLYLPEHAEGPLPAIVWVHGGAFRAGSKEDAPAARMVGRGYAVASINYRLSQEAIFPAQVHDCKAAVRWLRAKAGRYGLDPGRIAAWGASAGGHLAAMLGTTGEVKELEGEGEHLEYTSRVQAVCDFFGPSDFLRMNDVPGTMDHDAADSPESQLIGGPIRDNVAKVARANPISYVTGQAPPFLIVHGDRDLTVLINQSELLYEALEEAGVDVTFHVVRGAGHGFHGATAEQVAEIDRMVDAFFDRCLKARL